jgi:hypothetical protein
MDGCSLRSETLGTFRIPEASQENPLCGIPDRGYPRVAARALPTPTRTWPSSPCGSPLGAPSTASRWQSVSILTRLLTCAHDKEAPSTPSPIHSLGKQTRHRAWGNLPQKGKKERLLPSSRRTMKDAFRNDPKGWFSTDLARFHRKLALGSVSRNSRRPRHSFVGAQPRRAFLLHPPPEGQRYRTHGFA